MKILGIDTSSRLLSIALAENTNIIREKSIPADRRHSSLLVPEIKDMLKRSRLSIDKVDVFAVGLGPGSFTGLRIGVSTIKGFGIAMKKPCIGVASIDALAINSAVLSKAKPWTNTVQGLALDKVLGRVKIVPIIDAKRENVYSAIYQRRGDQVIRLSDYLLVPLEKLMRKIKGEAVFLGDGVGLYREKIHQADKKTVFLDEKYWYPKAGNIIRLAFPKITKYKKNSLDKLNPIYLYPKDCQVKKK